ncbi:3-isopropylmalate dehydratase small subunit [Fusobacterium sp. IOR10]|uniref:3-isopropylmalate dehydratase small subunit n=1 Tax=Fusobacterium sp. IOR10 TaxID=2665157 RepID=UPI0013D134C9|nr:3-isopropylmalate dehydratase small subunit [Fusobacterium sp. IOR10]
MKAFTKYSGTIIPIMHNNIDTDQLIPKQYLKSTEKTGFGDYVFDEWRYNQDRSENENFNLNKPQYKTGTILITGENFGCGSSREHAAWALQDYGIHVIIAGSYSGIFYMNWLNNGHLPIILPRDQREKLALIPGDEKITIDLENNKVITNEFNFSFQLEESWKTKLLKGLDAIDVTLESINLIKEYENKNY